MFPRQPGYPEAYSGPRGFPPPDHSGFGLNIVNNFIPKIGQASCLTTFSKKNLSLRKAEQLEVKLKKVRAFLGINSTISSFSKKCSARLRQSRNDRLDKSLRKFLRNLSLICLPLRGFLLKSRLLSSNTLLNRLIIHINNKNRAILLFTKQDTGTEEMLVLQGIF